MIAKILSLGGDRRGDFSIELVGNDTTTTISGKFQHSVYWRHRKIELKRHEDKKGRHRFNDETKAATEPLIRAILWDKDGKLRKEGKSFKIG